MPVLKPLLLEFSCRFLVTIRNEEWCKSKENFVKVNVLGNISPWADKSVD